MGKSEVEFCQFQELARSFFGTLNGSSSTIVFFAGAVSFVLVIVRVIRHPRAAPIISATVSGVHGRQWKSPYRALPLRVLGLLLRVSARDKRSLSSSASSPPNLSPANCRAVDNTTAVVARRSTARQLPARENPFSRP